MHKERKLEKAEGSGDVECEDDTKVDLGEVICAGCELDTAGWKWGLITGRVNTK